jgi:hypothetical protein
MKTLLPKPLTALALTLAAGTGALAAPVFQPIAISPTNYNADAIVEKTATGLWRSTTATVDGGTNVTGNTWFEIGYYGTQVTPNDVYYPTQSILPGAPHPGATFNGFQTNYDLLGGGPGASPTPCTNGTYVYQMAPDYTKPDAILIDTTIKTNYIALTTPAAYGALSFLDSSGNGGNSIAITVYHQDGTTDTGTIAAGDWFGGANPAYITYGRVVPMTGGFQIVTSPGNPRWYGRDLKVNNSTSPVTGIGFGYVGGAANVHNHVMAVSGASTPQGPFLPITFTGYAYTMIVPANSTQPGPVLATVGPNANSPATTMTMDNLNNTGNTWFEQGYSYLNQPLAGAPPQGSTFTNIAGDHAYTMAPDYTTNDVVYLAPGSNNIPITFNTAQSYYALSLLNGTGNGPEPINVQVNFNDGSSETHILSALDWFSGGSSTVWFNNGRVAADTGALNNINAPPSGVSSNTPAGNAAPFIYSGDIALTTTNKPVTGVLLSYQGGTFTNSNGRTAIFAVSGAAAPVPPAVAGVPTENLPNGTNGQVNAYPGDTVTFTIDPTTIVGTPPFNIQWQTDGGTVPSVFTNFVDNGTAVMGSQTTTLTLANVQAGSTRLIRVLAGNNSGSNASAAILFTVAEPTNAAISNIFTPGDPISLLSSPVGLPGTTPGTEGVTHAIDGLLGSDPGKYLNFGGNGGAPFLGPIGFVATPSAGASIVTGIQLYTANDTATGGSNLQVPSSARDPKDMGLYGSNDGGKTWHFIYGNSALTPPTGRNAGSSAPYNVTTNYMQQILFTNTSTYFTYMWMVTNVFNDAANNSMQIGEVVLLGSVNPAFGAGYPTVSAPASARSYLTNGNGVGPNSVTITASVGGASPALQWYKQINGTYVALTNGGNISGVTTSNLTINNTSYSDAGNYELTASNSFGVSSTVVPLYVYAPAQSSTTPGQLSVVTSTADTIADFNDLGLGSVNAVNGGNDESPNLLNPSIMTYVTPGLSPNAGAGFVPYVGPAGFVVNLVDPNSGNPAPFIVTGIRLYAPTTSYDSVLTDDQPNDVEIYGSNNGGSNYTLVYSNSGPAVYMSPPYTNVINEATDPVGAFPQESLVELLFPNPTGYSTYKIQFTHTRNDQAVNGLYLGHMDLLGVEGAGVVVNNPSLTFSYGSGKLTLTSSAAGEVFVTSALNPPNTAWHDAGPISANGSAQFNISTSSNAFYEVIVNPTPPIH